MSTTLLTFDEYMVLLEQRLAEWQANHPGADPRCPPLLPWFVRDGDEDLVAPVTIQGTPKPEPKPKAKRRHRSATEIGSEISQVQAQMDRLGRPLSDDPAAARLSDVRLLRRSRARMDRELEQYAELARRLQRLRMAHVAAAGREAEADEKEEGSC